MYTRKHIYFSLNIRLNRLRPTHPLSSCLLPTLCCLNLWLLTLYLYIGKQYDGNDKLVKFIQFASKFIDYYIKSQNIQVPFNFAALSSILGTSKKPLKNLPETCTSTTITSPN